MGLVKNKIKSNFPLSTLTTFRLGGPAKFYLATTSPEEAVAGIITAQERGLDYHILAGGSNTVFPDRGFAGLVIHFIQPKFNKKSLEIKGQNVIVSSGVILMDLVKEMSRLGLAGAEKMSAIPGCVGGAIVGNAGAYGQFIGDLVNWVEIFDGKIVRRLARGECRFAYRHSIFKEKKWLILRVSLKLKKGEAKKLTQEVKSIAKLRWQKFGRHPICAGSFFKNVEVKKVTKKSLAKIDPTKISDGKISAGYLIGEAFLPEASPRARKVGGISIAPFHNNFLLNDGTGTTRDLIKLSNKIKLAVKKKFGITLEEEVRLSARG